MRYHGMQPEQSVHVRPRPIAALQSHMDPLGSSLGASLVDVGIAYLTFAISWCATLRNLFVFGLTECAQCDA